jgi:hypothetical protein
MDAARGDAKTAAFAALSDAHRGQVQAIVDKFDADGSTLTLTDAASQIDAVLTPEESTAVLAQRQKLRDAMRAAYAGSTPGGRGFGGGAAGRGGRSARSADAGRFVLQVDAAPERFRDAMRAERGNG